MLTLVYPNIVQEIAEFFVAALCLFTKLWLFRCGVDHDRLELS